MGYDFICEVEHECLYAPYVEEVDVAEGHVCMVVPEQIHGIVYQRFLANFGRTVHKHVLVLPQKVAYQGHFAASSYELGAGDKLVVFKGGFHHLLTPIFLRN